MDACDLKKQTKTRFGTAFFPPASFTTTPTFAVQNYLAHLVHAISVFYDAPRVVCVSIVHLDTFVHGFSP